MMSHIAMLEVTGARGDPTTWPEPVTDEQYRRTNATVERRAAAPEPGRREGDG